LRLGTQGIKTRSHILQGFSLDSAEEQVFTRRIIHFRNRVFLLEDINGTGISQLGTLFFMGGIYGR